MIEIDGVQIVMNSEVELSLRQEIMEKVSFILSVFKRHYSDEPGSRD